MTTEPQTVSHWKCRHCGQTVHRLILLALMEDMGAVCSPSSLSCCGGNHDFMNPEGDHENHLDEQE